MVGPDVLPDRMEILVMSHSLQGRITTVLTSGNFYVCTETEDTIGQSYTAYLADNPDIRKPSPGMRVEFDVKNSLAVGACVTKEDCTIPVEPVRHVTAAR